MNQMIVRHVPAIGGGGELFDWGGTQRYTLEFTRPHSSMDANDRWTAAYPGLEYNVRPGVIGGVYPFRYSLNNAPSGMTIDAATGEITWPNPQTTASNISITVEDTKGTSVTSATWSITVATTRFKFFSPSGDNTTGDGSLGSPWQTLGKFQSSTSTTTIGIFRTGTFITDDCDIVDGRSTRWGTALSRPSIFLAYPGETVVFDHGYVEGVSEGVEFDFVENGGSPRVYLDGLTHTKGHNKTIRSFLNHNFCIRRGIFHDYGPGTGGLNSAAIDWESGGFLSGTSNRDTVQDCEFYNQVYGTGNCALKIYATLKLLIEDCLFRDFDAGSEAAVAYKSGGDQITVRGCRSHDMLTPSYGGNQNNMPTGTCDGEVCFNNFEGPEGSGFSTVIINHDGEVFDQGQLHVYRNTVRGGVTFWFLDSNDGPYTSQQNVFVNDTTNDNPDGSHINHLQAAEDISRLTVIDDLTGVAADGILDANGLLQGAYRTTYLYMRGHEVPS